MEEGVLNGSAHRISLDLLDHLLADAVLVPAHPTCHRSRHHRADRHHCVHHRLVPEDIERSVPLHDLTESRP